MFTPDRILGVNGSSVFNVRVTEPDTGRRRTASRIFTRVKPHELWRIHRFTIVVRKNQQSKDKRKACLQPPFSPRSLGSLTQLGLP